jgi:hypothetical protein
MALDDGLEELSGEIPGVVMLPGVCRTTEFALLTEGVVRPKPADDCRTLIKVAEGVPEGLADRLPETSPALADSFSSALIRCDIDEPTLGPFLSNGVFWD